MPIKTISPGPASVVVGSLVTELGRAGISTDAGRIQVGTDLLILYESAVPDADTIIEMVVAAHNPGPPKSEADIVRELVLEGLTTASDYNQVGLRVLGRMMNDILTQTRMTVNALIRENAALRAELRAGVLISPPTDIPELLNFPSFEEAKAYYASMLAQEELD